MYITEPSFTFASFLLYATRVEELRTKIRLLVGRDEETRIYEQAIKNSTESFLSLRGMLEIELRRVLKELNDGTTKLP